MEGHFGRVKTLTLVKATFYWSRMERDVARFVEHCNVCLMVKTTSQNTGLYTLLQVPNTTLGICELGFCCGTFENTEK